MVDLQGTELSQEEAEVLRHRLVGGVIVFSLVLVAAIVLSGNGNGLSDLGHGLWDVSGALLLGFLVGIPMSFLIGRNRPGEPTMVEAMGFVFICGKDHRLIGGKVIRGQVIVLLFCLVVILSIPHNSSTIKLISILCYWIINLSLLLLLHACILSVVPG